MDIIDVIDLKKEYGSLVAVNGISFSVSQGEIFAFLGPNGAGKSTTIKMLTTLLKPTSGKMQIDGKDPVTEHAEVRKSFGIVFQDPSLDDDLTAYENMEFHGVLYGLPKEIRRERIPQLLNFVGLWARSNDLVKHFSGGMKRRLEIARGLLHHPKILFLDEPTLGLDPQTRNHIWTYVQNLNREEGLTIFFTTHYMDEAERIARKIAVIDQGTIIAQGSPEQLIEQTGANSLENAFLSLTGKTIREEKTNATEQMKMHVKMHQRTSKR